MLSAGPVAFLTPAILVALAVLPVLWWLLRAVPPAPAKRVFPGVRLLLGLRDPEKEPVRTPWWLLLLRMGALAAAIFAFADPVLNPDVQARGDSPVLVAMDGSWASAPRWSDRQARAAEVLDQAARAGRPAAVMLLTDPVPGDPRIPFRDAAALASRVTGLVPQSWSADRLGFAAWLDEVSGAGDETGFETIWLTDGLAGEDDAAFLAALMARGPVTVVSDDANPIALTAPEFRDGAVRLEVLRAEGGARASLQLSAIGTDPRGIERVLGQDQVMFDLDADAVQEVALDLPLELRNRVTRLALPQVRSAGAVALADDGLKRRKIGLVAGVAQSEQQRLNSPLFFLRKALEPSADLIEAPLADILTANPDVIIFADVGRLGDSEREGLIAWIEAGGLLIRFAGPRLAQSGEGQLEEDPLLPVRLRAGGRNVGGAMSWGAPKQLRPFPETSPFYGLPLPDDVDVTSQVMAQPDPNLPDRVMAALEDGTPLVTGRNQGEGRVVLFHVTASAQWSNLPLTVLYVQMLERLAVSTRGAAPEATDLEGQTWTPVAVLDGFGTVQEPKLLTGVDGARLINERPGPDMPPGLYQAGDRRFALNLFRAGDTLSPLAPLPAGVTSEAMGVVSETILKPWLILVALGLLALDILATLWIGGRLSGPRMARAAMILLALGLVAAPPPGSAQTEAAEMTAAEQRRADQLALRAATETVLAYVVTGDPKVDRISEAGMRGISTILGRRTAVEPGDPVAVDLENDEISFLPFLYWPVSEAQDLPSDAAYAKLNQYLRSGGMILFDTRDANLGGGPGGGTPNGRVLQRLAAKLDIPALEPAPPDHVMTRTFYLLKDFPGRYANTDVWVEAAPNAEEVEGMPFRNLNDGVTPVVIGANDWAAAWAMDERGVPMLPVGRGTAGARQREMAYRFGVNLIMHVMTGNYKSDQVHVPALLDRLGN
ncbi:DUF4159 domain-containing protein [Halovulum sp. GXIMD14793]